MRSQVCSTRRWVQPIDGNEPDLKSTNTEQKEERAESTEWGNITPWSIWHSELCSLWLFHLTVRRGLMAAELPFQAERTHQGHHGARYSIHIHTSVFHSSAGSGCVCVRLLGRVVVAACFYFKRSNRKSWSVRLLGLKVQRLFVVICCLMENNINSNNNVGN